MKEQYLVLFLVFCGISNHLTCGDDSTERQETFYTAFDDASWAIRTPNLSPVLHRQGVYDEFMESCQKVAPENFDCQAEEESRLFVNSLQPESLVNYTKTGFLLTKAPKQAFEHLKEFFQANQDQLVVEPPENGNASIYHNTWTTLPSFVSIENENLPGGGLDLLLDVSNEVRQVVEQWTGQRQSQTSVYGIRVYHNQSILTPHVDVMPLICSAIINVAQDVDEDWPLEVYDHDGVAHNVTMKAGDMVLYESATVVHGRPFALQGRYFANIFVHFEAIGAVDSTQLQENLDLPPYLLPNSKWEPEWRQDNPNGWNFLNKVWRVVQRGDLETLKYMVAGHPSVVHRATKDGWQPIHEAARWDNVDMVIYLTEQGVDINVIAHGHGDYSPLGVAQDFLGDDHEITLLLVRLGAVSSGRTSVSPNESYSGGYYDAEEQDEL